MQAPAIAPFDDGCQVAKSRLSPPVKWSQGTIISAVEVMFNVAGTRRWECECRNTAVLTGEVKRLQLEAQAQQDRKGQTCANRRGSADRSADKARPGAKKLRACEIQHQTAAS